MEVWTKTSVSDDIYIVRFVPHHDDSFGRCMPEAQAVVSQQSQAGVEEQRG